MLVEVISGWCGSLRAHGFDARECCCGVVHGVWRLGLACYALVRLPVLAAGFGMLDDFGLESYDFGLATFGCLYDVFWIW